MKSEQQYTVNSTRKRRKRQLYLIHWELVFFNIVQIIQLPSIAELHGKDPSTGVPPVDSGSLDEGEMFEHGRELLLVPGLLLEVQLIREVGSDLSSQPLEVEVGEDV